MLFGDLYQEYIKERENLEVIELHGGFICYKIENDHCLINDYYVTPALRRKRIGVELANKVFELCKEKGIHLVFCQSDERANGHEISRKAILNYGFQEYRKDGSIYHYVLELKKWEKQ